MSDRWTAWLGVSTATIIFAFCVYIGLCSIQASRETGPFSHAAGLEKLLPAVPLSVVFLALLLSALRKSSRSTVSVRVVSALLLAAFAACAGLLWGCWGR